MKLLAVALSLFLLGVSAAKKDQVVLEEGPDVITVDLEGVAVSDVIEFEEDAVSDATDVEGVSVREPRASASLTVDVGVPQPPRAMEDPDRKARLRRFLADHLSHGDPAQQLRSLYLVYVGHPQEGRDELKDLQKSMGLDREVITQQVHSLAKVISKWYPEARDGFYRVMGSVLAGLPKALQDGSLDIEEKGDQDALDALVVAKMEADIVKPVTDELLLQAFMTKAVSMVPAEKWSGLADVLRSKGGRMGATADEAEVGKAALDTDGDAALQAAAAAPAKWMTLNSVLHYMLGFIDHEEAARRIVESQVAVERSMYGAEVGARLLEWALGPVGTLMGAPIGGFICYRVTENYHKVLSAFFDMQSYEKAVATAYEYLGVSPDATDAEVLAAYEWKTKMTDPTREGAIYSDYREYVKAPTALAMITVDRMLKQ